MGRTSNDSCRDACSLDTDEGAMIRQQAPSKEEGHPPLGSVICRCKSNMHPANLTPEVVQLLSTGRIPTSLSCAEEAALAQWQKCMRVRDSVMYHRDNVVLFSRFLLPIEPYSMFRFQCCLPLGLTADNTLVSLRRRSPRPSAPKSSACSTDIPHSPPSSPQSP